MGNSNHRRKGWVMVLLVLGMLSTTVQAEKLSRLDKDRYLDKCKGAWIGQMIGVSYAGPYEFVSCGKMILEDLRPWSDECYYRVLDQDDLYVELNFLKALEIHGLDITPEQAGRVFGDFKARLWHANQFGRENVRAGIMPPLSGHPKYNRHADDIDFQIEADVLGIICPGMPQESNRLCDIFGHIVNYGDGVYGGMFVAGMYAEAYFEDKDVMKVIEAGLACIPAESDYHKIITDVIAWHKESPQDWQQVWKKIEAKWQDDIDCAPDDPYNIDAKLNGAYIVMGMLYGEGDFDKTMDISLRCGQDADCNPANNAGILGCMYGWSGIDRKYLAAVPDFADKKFNWTDYSFNGAVAASQRVTERIVVEQGGKVTDDAYLIARQQPVAAPLEQWENQMEILSHPIPQSELNLWDMAFRVQACGMRHMPGVRNKVDGRDSVLIVPPVSSDEPAILVGEKMVPPVAQPQLYVPVTTFDDGRIELTISVNGQAMKTIEIASQGRFVTQVIDLPGTLAGRSVTIELKVSGEPSRNNVAVFDRIEIM